ncbi:GrpB family protein [Fulvivirga lutimaris]|uniref:GrpB family protein n=1 Tax=Fulvivirga lutimaris TaxID=1819566 RepID=UPI0012BD0330|nr:GrpB family protein [Fulvivirga lutimaris]MTI41117.1 GrpB family protein [Fulvivirga lutimaris]
MESKKSLYDLTKEDWNTLFPVKLYDHNPEWKVIFKLEKEVILDKLGDDVLRIEHFGSTSIPNIKAKPYIDIIIEIEKEKLFDEDIISKLSELEYTHFKVPEREGIDAYMSFGKGYNLEGENGQIFHIHMCPKDNYMWNQLDFRDYLIANPDRAKAYEKLKLELADKYVNDRGNYMLSKTDFIKETLALANK